LISKKFLLPSVSFLGTLKSSSLVTCLCPIELALDAVAVDWIGFDVVVELSVGGNSGLHGEWELVEVLVDVANGTPVDE
jgi:hypothetical protein